MYIDYTVVTAWLIKPDQFMNVSIPGMLHLFTGVDRAVSMLGGNLIEIYLIYLLTETGC
jgi:hypothetical protein